MRPLKPVLLFITSLVSTVLLHTEVLAASNTAQLETQAKPIIERLYYKLSQKRNININSRIEYISQTFLATPYLLSALGEGIKGEYNQSPLYRFDAFDCETFVDTVIALALGSNVSSFEQCIRKIRYKDGHISLITRNHFTDLDWNKNNQAQGLVKDITTSILDSNQKSIAKIAKAQINKANWYQHFRLKDLYLPNLSASERAKRLRILKTQTKNLQVQEATIPYLPLKVLFTQSGKANLYLFKQIPHAAIIEIIRPNWNLREKIGTALNVSHLGFAIWKNNRLYFRQASSLHKKVIDVPLIDYLHEARKSPTIKGINIQIVLNKNTNTYGC